MLVWGKIATSWQIMKNRRDEFFILWLISDGACWTFRSLPDACVFVGGFMLQTVRFSCDLLQIIRKCDSSYLILLEHSSCMMWSSTIFLHFLFCHQINIQNLYEEFVDAQSQNSLEALLSQTREVRNSVTLLKSSGGGGSKARDPVISLTALA